MFFLVSVSRHRRRAPTVIRASTELRFELGWRQIAKARVRSHVVVVPSPLHDPHLRVHAVPKPLQAQILVAELPVERFVGRILPRLPRLDERGFDLRLEQPPENRTRDKLGAVVGPEVTWGSVDAHELREHLDNAPGPNAAGHVDRE